MVETLHDCVEQNCRDYGLDIGSWQDLYHQKYVLGSVPQAFIDEIEADTKLGARSDSRP